MLSLFGAAGGGWDGGEPTVPCFRLTVLGPESSGKTSLITSWVNNMCPSAPAPTEATTFYHRMLRVHSPEDPNVLINGLVEIEDALSWPLDGAPSDRAPWQLPLVDTSAGISKSQPGAATIQRLEKNKPFPQLKKYAEATSSKPLQPLTGPAPKPLCTLKDGESPAGLAHRRMGYFIVYDAADPESLEQALRILECFFPPPSGVHLGCVYLVANKIDRDHASEAYINNVRLAQQRLRQLRARSGSEKFSTEQVQQADVSALEFTRVRKLFRDAVQSVFDKDNLHLARGAAGRPDEGARQGGLLSLGGWFGGGGGGT